MESMLKGLLLEQARQATEGREPVRVVVSIGDEEKQRQDFETVVVVGIVKDGMMDDGTQMIVSCMGAFDPARNYHIRRAILNMLLEEKII